MQFATVGDQRLILRITHVTLSLSLLFCLSAVSRARGGDPEPPPPNPANPVDYAAWIDQTFGGDIPDDQNAAFVYLEAYKLLTPFEGDWGDTDRPWTDNEDVANWLRRNRRALEKFKEAAGMEKCYFALKDIPIDRGLTGLPVDASVAHLLLKHHDAVKGLTAEGFYAWAQGDEKKLIENAVLVLRSGHHVSTNLTMMGRSVACTCCATAYDSILFALDQTGNRATLVNRLPQELHCIDPGLPPIERHILGQRLIVWEFVQREKGGPGVLREVNEYLDAVVEWTRAPYHEVAGREHS